MTPVYGRPSDVRTIEGEDDLFDDGFNLKPLSTREPKLNDIPRVFLRSLSGAKTTPITSDEMRELEKRLHQVRPGDVPA